MAQVSNESELSAALAGTDPSIQLTADIPVTKQLEVGRDVTISSLFPDVFALTKAAGHSQNLFRVASGASLHLNNIILDGDMASHPTSDSANRSLICVNGGSLYLEDGCILRNNYSAAEGGGVCLQAAPALANLLVMNGNALPPCFPGPPMIVWSFQITQSLRIIWRQTAAASAAIPSHRAQAFP